MNPTFVISGTPVSRNDGGKLKLRCDAPGCTRFFLARTREETFVILFMRATARGWGRFRNWRGIVLCPRCKRRL